ncbi:MAG: hypothetical protein LBD57_04435 [Endomicrobium sp.]|jgi:hypothetical protein|uniref:hypothetical protein n=1 Tax=Candidatus Endomicrobiellum cubanum TaxID=3242325 RepID=UPI0028309273|nr:hypothetical protein [Endomicrobium sp.]
MKRGDVLMRRKRRNHEESCFDSNYFNWLVCENTDLNGRNCVYTYVVIAKILFDTSFFFIHLMDRNRLVDGWQLRKDYRNTIAKNPESIDISEKTCNLLEMFIALSRRMEYNLFGINKLVSNSRECVFLFLCNLGLDCFSDQWIGGITSERRLAGVEFEIKVILNTFLNRTYEFDGTGGLFPLNRPKEDQREVEIWYQMHAYLNENFYFEDEIVEDNIVRRREI